MGREAVRGQLHGCTDFEVIAECTGGADAIARIRELLPDVVFLDIQMPGVDGFDVLTELGERAPITVMVTAFDQYAVRAFEHYALDYVLKPIEPGRFTQTLERIRRRVAGARSEKGTSELRDLLADLSGRTACPERLVFKATRGLVFLEPDELEWVESTGNYLKVHVGAEEYLVRETMAGFCNRLDAARFLRIHRSFFVNVNYVREIRLTGAGTDYELVLRTGRTLPVGRSYRDAVVARLEGQP
ncbi:MAG: response regulator transcription factor [bacterium]|nr:response regulator transcription factor [bacterium]